MSLNRGQPADRNSDRHPPSSKPIAGKRRHLNRRPRRAEGPNPAPWKLAYGPPAIRTDIGPARRRCQAGKGARACRTEHRSATPPPPLQEELSASSPSHRGPANRNRRFPRGIFSPKPRALLPAAARMHPTRPAKHGPVGSAGDRQGHAPSRHRQAGEGTHQATSPNRKTGTDLKLSPVTVTPRPRGRSARRSKKPRRESPRRRRRNGRTPKAGARASPRPIIFSGQVRRQAFIGYRYEALPLRDRATRALTVVRRRHLPATARLTESRSLGWGGLPIGSRQGRRSLGRRAGSPTPLPPRIHADSGDLRPLPLWWSVESGRCIVSLPT